MTAGGRAEHESLEFDQLVAIVLADGADAVVKLLRPRSPSAVRDVLVAEVERRAARLLEEARGNPVRAWDLLMAGRERTPSRSR